MIWGYPHDFGPPHHVTRVAPRHQDEDADGATFQWRPEGPEGPGGARRTFPVKPMEKPWKTSIYNWLVVWNMNFIFPYIGNNHPN